MEKSFCVCYNGWTQEDFFMSYYSAVTYLAVFSMVIMMLIVQSNDVLSR